MPGAPGEPARWEVQRTLLEMRAALHLLAQHATDVRLAGEPPVVRAVYQHLLDKDVEPALALDLAGQLAEEVGPGSGPDDPLAWGRLRELLAERLPAATLPPAGREPQVVILVGPTGAGKTTTVAKLAALLAFRQGRRVALATTDTVRVAAASQLSTYASLMELPLAVAYTPEELAAAVATRGDCDLILVDTPGCAPSNQDQVQELAAFVAAIPQAMVLLVLAAPTKYRDLEAAVEGFAAVPQHGIVLTKLDETAAPGPALSLAARRQQPVYFAATGQHVPADIQEATSSWLADLLAGEPATARQTTEAA
jgi:flagellar biosynthesis protein FlhF